MQIELSEEDLNNVNRYLDIVNGDINSADLEEVRNLKSAVMVSVAACVGAENQWAKLANVTD